MREAASAIPHLPSNLPFLAYSCSHCINYIAFQGGEGGISKHNSQYLALPPNWQNEHSWVASGQWGGGKCSCTDISSTPDLILTHLWYASTPINCQNILQHVTGDNLSWIGWNIAGSRVKVRREEEEWDCKQVSPGCNCAFVHFVCYKLMIFHNFHLANQTM